MIETFTLDNLIKIGAPGLTREKASLFFAPLSSAMENYQINTVLRTSAFLAQAMHESSFFGRIEENLNYSATRLMAVFPNRFPTQDIALQYERKPKAIANRAYANKGNNGDEASGDGYKYRGRGIFQLTLKGNYASLTKDTNIDFVNNPDLLLQPEYACISACHFFKKNGLNELADKGLFDELTKRVNSAKLGLEERRKFYNRALLILKG